MNIPQSHLLLVEDDSLIAYDIARTLEIEGALSVTIVKYDPHTILESIRNTRPDVILLEVCQWQEDRFALMRQIADEGIPVIAGTICDEYRDGVTGFEDVPVLIKPYDPGKLLSMLATAIPATCGLDAVRSQKIAS